jgi:hypothetical protein
MNTHRSNGKGIPQEGPGTEKQPEIIPAAEPVEPVIPAEDKPEIPAEMPSRISPYDFPPPGPGIYPELF